MRRFCQFFVLIIGLLSSYFVVAQQTDNNLKVGFVNIRKLMVQAPQLEQIQNKLAKEFESKNQEIINHYITSQHC